MIKGNFSLDTELEGFELIRSVPSRYRLQAGLMNGSGDGSTLNKHGLLSCRNPIRVCSRYLTMWCAWVIDYWLRRILSKSQVNYLWPSLTQAIAWASGRLWGLFLPLRALVSGYSVLVRSLVV